MRCSVGVGLPRESLTGCSTHVRATLTPSGRSTAVWERSSLNATMSLYQRHLNQCPQIRRYNGMVTATAATPAKIKVSISIICDVPPRSQLAASLTKGSTSTTSLPTRKRTSSATN